MNELETAAEIIQTIIYMNVATVCEDGSPWNSPVYCAYDQDLNFYWTSSPGNVRSKNIERDGRTFITIYDSTVPGGTGKGVYLRGQTEILSDPQTVAKARQLTQSRKGKDIDESTAFLFSENSARKIYCFTPSHGWVNTYVYDKSGVFINDDRFEIDLENLKSSLS